MQARWQMVQQARNGGSLTPEMMTHLRQLERQGQLTVYERCQIHAEWKGEAWKVCCDTLSA
jgi:desulfoferrodoxin (superoxide reductase-like protein)